MSGSGDRIVRGVVVIPDGASIDSSVMTVVVEDVSRADAASQPVAESTRRLERVRAGDRITFEVRVPAERIDPARHYAVRVHVDRSGSGDVKIGDLVSTQSYPVLTRGHGTEHVVTVKRV